MREASKELPGIVDCVQKTFSGRMTRSWIIRILSIVAMSPPNFNALLIPPFAPKVLLIEISDPFATHQL